MEKLINKNKGLQGLIEGFLKLGNVLDDKKLELLKRIYDKDKRITAEEFVEISNLHEKYHEITYRSYVQFKNVKGGNENFSYNQFIELKKKYYEEIKENSKITEDQFKEIVIKDNNNDQDKNKYESDIVDRFTELLEIQFYNSILGI